jgi:hypothetical protein
MAASTVRNEFGLDEQNALDVQKERLKDGLPFVIGVVALIAITAFMVAVTNKQSS